MFAQLCRSSALLRGIRGSLTYQARSFSSDSVREVVNADVVRTSTADLSQFLSDYSKVHFDLGTGDGRYLYKLAQKDPSTAYVGVDASLPSLLSIANKAKRKPTKGGLKHHNFKVLLSPVEDLPRSLSRVADRITVNFPWVSLMDNFTRGDPTTLRVLSNLAKDDGELSVCLNSSVYDDPAYLKKMNFVDLTQKEHVQMLRERLRSCGFTHIKISPNSGEFPRTTWGNHLVRASNRSVLSIHCRKVTELKAK